jgi:putative ABC transport system permease protein
MDRQSTENTGWIHCLLRRLRNHTPRWRRHSGEDNVRDRRLQREIEDELTFHLEMRTRENLAAGMSPEEARRQAKRRLGELDAVRGAGREIRGRGRSDRPLRRLLADLWLDAGYGLRSMVARPGFTTVALLTLTLGIGATTAVFSVVDGILIEAFPYEDPGALVMFQGRSVRPETVGAWRDGLGTLEAISFFSLGAHEMVGPSGASRVQSIPVDAAFFPTLGIRAARGRTFTADDLQPDAPLTAIVTDRFWRRELGGGAGAIGESIVLDGVAATIIGVMPTGFTFLRFNSADVFLPLWHSERRLGMAIGRLRDGVSLQQGRSDAERLAASLDADPILPREPLVNYYRLYDGVVGDQRSGILLLAGAVSFVLMIACANVANLLLARALGRREEISVRAALGASGGRLVRQLLTEATLLAILGGAMGVLVATAAMPALLAASPAYFPRLDNVGIDLRVLAFSVVVAALTGILFGLAPAAFARKADLRAAMVGGRQAGGDRGRRRLLDVVVVGEIALSLMLLVGTGMQLRAFLQLRPTEPGFDPHGKLTFSLRLAERRYPDEASTTTMWDIVLAELRATPGVTAATAISTPPMVGVAWSIEAIPEGMASESDDLPTVWLERAAADYHEVMDITLLRGRPLDPRAAVGPPEMVISEAARRTLWPDGSDPLGKTVRVTAPEIEFVVVGVAADTRRTGLSLRARPTVWVRYRDAPHVLMTFIVQASGDPRALAAPAVELVRRLDPELPVLELQTMDALLAGSVGLPRFYLTLMSIFAGIAILLAAIGFYGVMAYAVGRRTRELGIRVAIGASPGRLQGMVLRQGMTRVAIGVALGLFGCLASSRVLESVLFGFSATDPTIYGVFAGVVAAVGLVACYLPARRATRVDPLTSMRSQ